jgi:hypothetical protein
MGTEFNAKKPGVDIFKTGGVVLTDRQTDGQTLPIADFPPTGKIFQLEA